MDYSREQQRSEASSAGKREVEKYRGRESSDEEEEEERRQEEEKEGDGDPVM